MHLILVFCVASGHFLYQGIKILTWNVTTDFKCYQHLTICLLTTISKMFVLNFWHTQCAGTNTWDFCAYTLTGFFSNSATKVEMLSMLPISSFEGIYNVSSILPFVMTKLSKSNFKGDNFDDQNEMESFWLQVFTFFLGSWSLFSSKSKLVHQQLW